MPEYFVLMITHFGLFNIDWCTELPSRVLSGSSIWIRSEKKNIRFCKWCECPCSRSNEITVNENKQTAMRIHAQYAHTHKHTYSKHSDNSNTNVPPCVLYRSQWIWIFCCFLFCFILLLIASDATNQLKHENFYQSLFCIVSLLLSRCVLSIVRSHQ